MFRQFFCSREYALHAWLLGVFMLAILTASSLIMFLMNAWKGDFYAELERALNDNTTHAEPTEEYYSLAWRWVKLSVPLPILDALKYLTTSIWAFSWRKALTDDYQARFQRRSSDLALEGVSQRLQEDTRGLAAQINRLGGSFFGSLVTLCVFAPVLYERSPAGYGTPGILLWFCLVCNGGAFLISMVIGRPLVSLQYNIEKHEAAYRKELVFAEDQKVAAPGALVTWQALFRAVEEAYYRLFAYQSAPPL
jgi:peptide/bleomycin uptake transporter